MTETTTNETETETDHTRHLAVGDAFDLPDGRQLVVVGVEDAEATPESSSDGPLYECQLDGRDETSLYRPHNIRRGLEAGAEYVGTVDVDEETAPFWCDGCEHPHRGEGRRSMVASDVVVCSYGCGTAAEQAIAAERLEAVAEGGRYE